MWNYVKIGGSWYHVDVTADACADTPYMAFFNVTTESISKGRTIDREACDLTDEQLESGTYNCFVPPCNSTEYNYVSRCISDINELLPKSDKIVRYTVEGITGSCSFRISW